MLIDDGSPTAYRLAIMLIRKTLFSDDWEESWDEILEGLRQDATTNGVHPVWSKMAEATPNPCSVCCIPKSEVEEQEADKFDMLQAKIDPANGKSLAKTLATFEANSSDATVKMALNKAKAQLNGKKGLRVISGLENLEGEASVISVLIHIHLENDATESLEELSKSDSDLADAFRDLIELRNGNSSDWNNSRSLTDVDDLSKARKRKHGLCCQRKQPSSSDELQDGLELDLTPQQKETITGGNWQHWFVTAPPTWL